MKKIVRKERKDIGAIIAGGADRIGLERAKNLGQENARVLRTELGAQKADWSLRPLNDELGEALRAELLSWPGVTVRPVMGTLGCFRGRGQLGYYANRELSGKKPSWLNQIGEPTYACVRLRLADAERAYDRPGVAPARLSSPGWVEISLIWRNSLAEFVRCLGTAYENAPRNAGRAHKRKTRE